MGDSSAADFGPAYTEDFHQGIVNSSLDASQGCETALHESEERFRAIFNQPNMGIALNDPNGKWLLVNDRFCEIVGYSQAELSGKSFLEITHPDDRESCFAAVQQILAGELSAYSADKRYVRKDGNVVWVRMFAPLVRDAENRPKYFISVVEDITGKVEAESALRDSAQRLSLALSTGLGMWDYDLRTRSAIRSPLYAKHFGHAPSTHVEWMNLVHPDDRERIWGLVAESVTQKSEWEAEFRLLCPDGRVKWLLSKAAVVLDDHGEPVRMVGVSLDITERKETEASLRQSEEFFRKVFQEGPLGLGLVSPDFRFLKVNRALCQMVGYSEEELVGLSFIDITHPDDVQADVQAAERLFKGEISSYKMRKRYLTKAGESLHVSLTAALVRNQEREPVYGIAMIEDITETERNREAALARQKLESLGVLAGGIAHDFNNLLGGILAEAELVEADVSVGSASRAEIVRIKSAAVRGAEIVRELMIYAGQDQVSGMEPVDLSRLVEEMLELLKVSISKKIVLKTSLDEKLPIVWAQAPQIRQVVMNLVINAAEAIGSEQGVIKVSTSRSARTPGQDDVRNSASAEYVKMAVSDTGCGMTEELRAKIFDPFFTTKFAGRGLGLAVVLGIVRDHDGTVDVVSAPGQGATFEVFLPCTSKKPPTTPDGLTSFRGGQSSSRTATILVAEDEELLRLAVSKSLRKRGFSVLEANDGSAAIDLFRSHKDDIDLILLDVTLPGTSGREVFEEVLRLRPNMKIIVSSAYGKENVDATFRGLRIKHFIRKPFRLIELASMLEEVLSE